VFRLLHIGRGTREARHGRSEDKRVILLIDSTTKEGDEAMDVDESAAIDELLNFGLSFQSKSIDIAMSVANRVCGGSDGGTVDE
jgi:hypothetical protein